MLLIVDWDNNQNVYYTNWIKKIRCVSIYSEFLLYDQTINEITVKKDDWYCMLQKCAN